MPESGWQTAALAVNDASRGGQIGWSNAAGAATGAGSAQAHNPYFGDRETQLLVAYAPAGIVPQGAEVIGIEWEVRFPDLTHEFDNFEDLFVVADGSIGSTDFEGSVKLDFGSSVDVAHWGNGGKSLWGGTWTADDFTGAAGGFGIALRMEVEGRETGRVEEIRFRVHWEVVDQEAVLGEIAVEGLRPTLAIGSTLTPTQGDIAVAGLAPLLVSSFARWLSTDIDLDPLRLAQAATLTWDETIVGGTAVAVQARVKDENGVAGPWSAVENGGDLDPLLEAGDLGGQSLNVQVTLTTTALPATPRFANLSIEASGAYGLSQGFARNPLTGHLSPLSEGMPADDSDDSEDDDTFDDFVLQPVAESIYDAEEIDIGFDDRARLWAEVDSITGPGEGGLVDVTRYVAHRTEAEELPAMSVLTTEDAELRYARFRLQLDNVDTGALVRDFVPTVDQQERTINATIQVEAGGTAIVFSPAFHQLPGVEVTAAAEGGAARYGAWENRTTAGVTLHVFDAAGDSVGGEATYTITGV